MREIKFRAWFPKEYYSEPHMAYQDDEPGRNTRTWHLEELTHPDPDGAPIYMQYTGLKDKNGVEIYEGDLFGVTNPNGEIELVGEVIFDTDFAQFTIKYTNGGWAELWQHLNTESNRARDVIGNIYETPNLLEQPHE